MKNKDIDFVLAHIVGSVYDITSNPEDFEKEEILGKLQNILDVIENTLGKEILDNLLDQDGIIR